MSENSGSPSTWADLPHERGFWHWQHNCQGIAARHILNQRVTRQAQLPAHIRRPIPADLLAVEEDAVVVPRVALFILAPVIFCLLNLNQSMSLQFCGPMTGLCPALYLCKPQEETPAMNTNGRLTTTPFSPSSWYCHCYGIGVCVYIIESY